MNKVILIGNITRDPEMRTTSGDLSVCNFGLAVNRRRKVEGQPDADFFNVTAWRQLGELCARYLEKGRKVCVVGQIQTRTYEDKDGIKRTATDVIADDVEFLPSGGKGEQAATPSPQTQATFTPVPDEPLPF